MGASTVVSASESIDTSAKTAAEAAQLLNRLESANGLSVSLNVSGEGSETVAPELFEALKQALAVISRGGRVRVEAEPIDLTSTVAAKRIGVSRPTLMKLVRAGEIPAHKVGSHTRIRTEDADAYRVRLLAEKASAQRQAFEELLALEEELEN